MIFLDWFGVHYKSLKIIQPFKKTRYHANLWTGTIRLSKTQFIDEYGEKFTVNEFSEKVGAKDSVSGRVNLFES